MAFLYIYIYIMYSSWKPNLHQFDIQNVDCIIFHFFLYFVNEMMNIFFAYTVDSSKAVIVIIQSYVF